METALRQSLIMSGGDFLIFWASPVTAVLMSIFTLVIVAPVARSLIWLYRRSTHKAAGEKSLTSVIVPCLVLLAFLAPTIETGAQDYPNRPISLVVPYPPGGRTDLTGRAVAQYLKTELGQPVVVVNKPGAGGVLGAKEVAAATPDGYTLGIFSTGFLTAQIHGTNTD